MSRSLLFVETKPASAEQVSDYHKWHDDVHIPEMLEIDGFVSARRWQPDGTDTFITLYEIDTDVETAKANLKAAFQSGRMSPPVAVDTDTPAIMRYLDLISEASR
ncbi:hypothetical protein [Gordonia rhizosphera]|uniref:EthD domain-containing protein n=1 Tax=Gordonia rhizosphera NBRC 16068 TaxID=1108045 RepID=K6VUU8_9ACTN|nr:hypothetical protein [Gordonia rhizosphera]GAB90675.1 hypothetical protein GORHZ_115_00290 [Gordonia rhizosphera NBRC 16068]